MAYGHETRLRGLGSVPAKRGPASWRVAAPSLCRPVPPRKTMTSRLPWREWWRQDMARGILFREVAGDMSDRQPARELYSGLAFLLEGRGLTPADLLGRIRALGEAVDARTLQRLLDPDRPIRQVDSRVAELVCRALGVELGDFLVFAAPLAARLTTLPPAERRRLDALLNRHGEVELRGRDLLELRRLVDAEGEIGLQNARRMLEHRERVREGVATRRHSAAD